MSVTMPTEIGRLPFFPVEFDKRQRLVDASQPRMLHDHLRDAATTDLLVVSHGWNNHKEEALKLYGELLTNVAQQAPGRWAGREVAVLGVFWPSKKFADSELIPGGAASGVTGDLPTHELVAEIEQLRGFFDDGDLILDRLRELAPRVADSSDARREFAAAIRELVTAGEDPEVHDEIPTQFFSMDGAEMLDELGAPHPDELAAVEGGDRQGGIAVVGGSTAGGDEGTEGGAAFLGSAFSGLRSGARNALNLATYYTMKRRAGETGQRGLAPALRQIRGDHRDLRIHLAGHSFGGRLVAAAALGEDESDPPLPVESIVLLQAAFSHNGFAEYEPGKDGYFRRVMTDRRVRGPLVVTHTRRDRANTWAYPMASRLARDRSAAFGGPNSPYGSIGTNGALKVDAKLGKLLAVGGDYGFSAGDVRNLESSAFIGDHGAVTGPEVAHAIVEAVASS